jgi:hypothetical protein
MAQCVFLAWMAITLAPSIASAQSPPHQASIDLKGSIGYTGVFDDDAHHLHTSAAARLYLTDRFSIEPEVQYLRASLHDDVVIAANVNFDLRRGRLIPYVSGGIGVANSDTSSPKAAWARRSRRVDRGSSRRTCDLAITFTSGPASELDTLSDQRPVKVDLGPRFACFSRPLHAVLGDVVAGSVNDERCVAAPFPTAITL